MSIQALYSAATGMSAMETKLDVIANNLANVQTTAFKQSRVNFEDLLYRNETLPGALDSSQQRTSTGVAIGTGTKVESTQMNLSQGNLTATGNALDVAIQGPGFFQVQDPSGNLYYTRAGNFALNPDGKLCVGSASIGRLVNPQSPITIPQGATNIQISPEGLVTYLPANSGSSNAATQAGQITLALFMNPQGLLQMGENLYGETESSGTPQLANPAQQGRGTLVQNNLEASNADPVQSLIDLITTQRSFEFNSQMINAGDQILQLVANLRRSQ
jgi:flagellar basal-body rod protein FlgG